MNHLNDLSNEELLEEYTNLFRQEDSDLDAELRSLSAYQRAQIVQNIRIAYGATALCVKREDMRAELLRRMERAKT